ncbi:hypothetical protein TNCV_1631721 [Trichonephila clavipes]|nr:hypothetical protein TNCV_1631721 [Trichonephila clavipes]
MGAIQCSGNDNTGLIRSQAIVCILQKACLEILHGLLLRLMRSAIRRATKHAGHEGDERSRPKASGMVNLRQSRERRCGARQQKEKELFWSQILLVSWRPSVRG